MKKKIRFKISLLSWFILFSCGNARNSSISESSIESSPKIIFLNYSIKEIANGDRNIRFLNKIVTDGQLKNAPSSDTGTSGDLVCVQLDKKSNVLQRSIIKNPLVKNIEYLNESNAFQKKRIDLDSTQFSIRLQLKPHTKHISIYDFSTFENRKKPLIQTQVQ